MKGMDAVVTIHSVYRWVVLAAVLGAVGFGLARYRAGAGWSAGSDRPYAVASILFDIQIAIGIVVWLGKKAWTLKPFLAFIHPVAMLVAVGVFHMAVARARRQASTRSHLTMGIGALAALVIVVVAIPWAGVS